MKELGIGFRSPADPGTDAWLFESSRCMGNPLDYSNTVETASATERANSGSFSQTNPRFAAQNPIYAKPIKIKLPRPTVIPPPAMTNEAMILPYNQEMGAYYYAGDPAQVQVLAGKFDSLEKRVHGTSTFKPDSAPVIMETSLDDRLRCYEAEAKKQKKAEHHFQREQEFLRSSLRTSQRLQALEKRSKLKPPSPPSTSFSSGSDSVETSEILINADGSPVLRERDGSSRQGFDSGLGPGRWEPSTGHECAAKIIEDLYAARAHSPESRELQTILACPNMHAVLMCHSEVAQTQPSVSHIGETSGLKETVLDGSRDAGSVRVVRLMKDGKHPLGATVKNDNGSILIGRVIRGGIAERSGVLRENDEVLEINGTNVRGMSVAQVCDVLALVQDEVTFITVPAPIENTPDRDLPGVRHLRALFDYQPYEDPYLPCKELGLDFHRGDILHVISTKDDSWWQAFRDGDSNPLAGLIPSMNFQIRREQYHREILDTHNDSVQRSNSFFCNGRVKGTLKIKRSYSSQMLQGPEQDKIFVYEEVCLHVFRTGYKRPVVLVGPPNVGCLELRAKLIQLDHDRFSGVVPHTSRPRRPGEVDGVHYWFVSKHAFQQDVKQLKFVEWGEYQKHYYGTSIEAVRNVVNRGQTCVLTLKAQSLEALRKSDVMPYVIFIYPPTLDKLRANRRLTGQGVVKDEELKKIIEEAKLTESAWGHYFDKTIVNYDLERTFSELLMTIHRLDTEPQWVPCEWVRKQ